MINQHCCTRIQGRCCFPELQMLTVEKSFSKSHNRDLILLKKCRDPHNIQFWSGCCVPGTWIDLNVLKTWKINHAQVPDLEANTTLKKPEEKNNAIHYIMLKHDYSCKEGIYAHINTEQMTLPKGLRNRKYCDCLLIKDLEK